MHTIKLIETEKAQTIAFPNIECDQPVQIRHTFIPGEVVQVSEKSWEYLKELKTKYLASDKEYRSAIKKYPSQGTGQKWCGGCRKYKRAYLFNKFTEV